MMASKTNTFTPYTPQRVPKYLWLLPPQQHHASFTDAAHSDKTPSELTTYHGGLVGLLVSQSVGFKAANQTLLTVLNHSSDNRHSSWPAEMQKQMQKQPHKAGCVAT